MKKFVVILLVVGATVLTMRVFAQEEQQASLNEELVNMPEDVINDNAVMDEGYGEDAEYFGAEVNGVDDGYLEEGLEVAVNAEVPQVPAE